MGAGVEVRVDERRIDGPAAWWRQLCWVTPQLALCGDLVDRGEGGRRQLDEWVDAGITHIVDVRIECNDELFVARHTSRVAYTWLGVDDHGGPHPDAWFVEGVAAIERALNEGGRVVVHCHMGVNRAPSLAFAVMVAAGEDPVEALATIRAARPIAAVLHAEDAIRWWHRRIGSTAEVAEADRLRVVEWLVLHPVDANWIISRLRE